MNRTACFYGVFLMMATILRCQESPAVVISLFEKGSGEWFQGGDAEWAFNGNELTGTVNGGSGFVMTNERYRNFELELEFFPDSTINSGVFVRCRDKELSNIDCYEMNIWDLHPDQKWRTGAIVTRAAPLANVATLNQWNTYKIVCRDNRIQTWINDSLMTDFENRDLIEGAIALQAAERGSVKFRNVILTAGGSK